ncbi:MAG: ATP-binding cassette domain-containing protein [Deltaproteobacteria bacterium]|jgi:multiple sugar transport system ATP-binding protein|nr:ATP-binding cassette domain-containing protein [Deltaproteobacteria bacterium]PNV87168.1 MAG: ABC transporter ATP-binding protein [Desulfobacteraceae bacterium]MDH3773043.1 ATP-binding cassette domain-containing protein [Deltaproteobacteria bacterium]MDH3801525.1 ATP-binding cassette domain-containing protein [Deltaproteobacteria bacterium]MDH3851690.1 ATP-binding cassette domain-containing protein [Deltaproteobacteria bacterium]
MAQVGTRGLKKYFGEVRAVDGVDLTTREGEFLVLLGPSGCGKTTLLRMIAGLERPSAGEVLIDDQVVNELPPRVRKIAMVFQNYALYPHMTVFKNIVFPLKAQKVPKDQWKQKVVTAASMFGIEKLLERKPRELSGGERQRVALARAMVREPTVFLFDEPLSNLDAKLRHSARFELKRFQEEIGITTIYVTHDQVEAMGLGDRIAVMSEGRVRQIGAPREVYHEPADTFVATFMGSPPMNLIQRDEVLVGIRPECFLPKEIYDVSDDLRSFQFRVWRVEHLGSDRLVYGSLDQDGEAPEEAIIAKVPLNVSVSIQKGQVYEFAVLAQDIKLFDRETGLRTEKKFF